MKRRTFLLAVGMLAGPGASLAQQASRKVHRIGFLGSGAAASVAKPLEALKARLRELGYVEGRNLGFETRFAEGRFERLPGLVEELLRLKVDLLAVWGTPGTSAAKRATSAVPIVMVNVGDPDATGLIASLARPGGNITGIANLGGSVVAKQMELLRQVFPGIARIAVLRNPTNPSLDPQMKGAEDGSRALGIELQVHLARSVAEIEAAFAAMPAGRPEAVLVLADPLFFDQGRRIAELAVRARLPSVSARAEVADAGILITYGASTVEVFRAAAHYIDKVLRGAKPADLPVEQASKFELVFNLRTARALGLTLAPALLIRADRVIE